MELEYTEPSVFGLGSDSVALTRHASIHEEQREHEEQVYVTSAVPRAASLVVCV